MKNFQDTSWYPIYSEPPSEIPEIAGVYIFRDAVGRVLYVGKARNIKKRIQTYWHKPLPPKTSSLMAKARSIEFVTTHGEDDALILEAQLIKKFRPSYNVILRDDKNYPALRINLREVFPRLEIVRRMKKDGAVYFGPYTSASTLKEAIKALRKAFPLRSCSSENPPSRSRPCLNYDIGLCTAPCCKLITQEEYIKIARSLVEFLSGRCDNVRSELTISMQEAARRLEFEKAARYRDRIRALEAIISKQRISSGHTANQDFIGIWTDDKTIHLTLVFMRQGNVTGQRNVDLSHVEGSLEEIISSFIRQYYSEKRFVPDEIIVSVNLYDREILESFLKRVRNKKVTVNCNPRGYRKEILALTLQNARDHAKTGSKVRELSITSLQKLADFFGLHHPPNLIACVDISNLYGRHTVGGVVIFHGGLPVPHLYRAYDLDNVDIQGDTAMMVYTISRFREEEPELFNAMDLLVLDGGKGHLNMVLQSFKNHSNCHQKFPLTIAIAKERNELLYRGERLSNERLYIPSQSDPVFFPDHPDMFRPIQAIRDEAHNFALINYRHKHRTLLTHSVLDTIPGIGPKRKTLLIQYFGDVDKLKKAELEDILAVPGIPSSLARKIYDFFHSITR